MYETSIMGPIRPFMYLRARHRLFEDMYANIYKKSSLSHKYGLTSMQCFTKGNFLKF